MTRRPTFGWLAGPLVITGTVMLFLGGARAASVAGSQGTDTALPATESEVTVHGRGAYADLAITVNQTAQLTNQTVSVTWTGGTPTVTGPGRFGQHYLQLFQCWGDDDGTVADNPGPPPEQCVQGAVAGTYGGLPGGLYPSGFALSRVISRTTWPNYDAAVGHTDAATTNVWMPFRAVDGTEVPVQTDASFNPAVQGGNFWLDPYFNIITTNEIAGAVTGSDGKGAELFQVNTGVESSGLGCGQKVQPVAGGGTKVPQCWLVVVPRGSAADENVGTPYASTPDQFGVATSPLSPSAWQHRIAIPLSFNPVDSPCELGADEQRISGSELALPAVASWQPALCTAGGLPPFAYAPVSDAGARQQLAAGADGGPGMAVVSKPLDQNTEDNPVVYAPLTVSGLTVAFNIERNPTTTAPADAQALAGVRVASLQLTPRLVAKLLTQSYQGAVSIQAAPDYPWLVHNPAHLGLDPDFLRFNPEFEQLQIADSRTFSGLELPAGNSDAAEQLWEWVLADPEARAWLGGAPDEWGMVVNPYYSTDASKNPSGIAFGSPLPTSFPKAEPYCYQAPARGPGNSIVPPLLCGTDWMPYMRGFADAARVGRVAFDGAKIVENSFAQASSEVWTRDLPQFLGRRSMLVLTDTPSAAQFGLQTASLSRAGDDGATRTFVAPDTTALLAGVAAMTARQEPAVLQPVPTASAPTAYPLTTVTYGAVTPLRLDTTSRDQFAKFVEYAVGAGQVPGLSLGQLPRGYAPLPAAMKTQALTAAARIRTLQAPPTTTSTEPATSVDSFPGGGGGGGGGGDEPPPDTTPVTEPATTTTTVPTTPATTTPATTTTVLTTAVSPTGTRYAVPGLGLVTLGSVLGALEITKRPRRARPDAGDDAHE